MRGIVLHGGTGTRLRPLTHTGPKQLIPIANKPVSQYAVEDLVDCGVRDIAFVLGNVYPEKVKEYYRDGSRFGAKFAYILQGEPKGIAHAVGLCRQFAADTAFIVYLGDNLLKGGIRTYAQEFERDNPDAMVLLSKVSDPSRFGVANLDEHGQLLSLQEKPKKPSSDLALTGIYMLRPSIFDAILKLRPSWRNELEITEAIQILLREGGRIAYHVVEGWWKDTGTPEDIIESNRLVLDELQSSVEGTVEDASSIQGRVSIGKGSRVQHGARIRGPSVIGEGTAIGRGVYIGPYTSIGSNVQIKRGEIEDSIIMDHCLIDTPYRIVGSIVGKHSVITSSSVSPPKGHKMVLGESCQVNL